MAEGGMYPWKVQTIKVPPIANYRTMALGEPPAGWEWSHNTTTREWTLREREVLAVPVLTTTTTTAPSTTTTPLLEDSSLVPLAHAEPIGMVESSSNTINLNTSTSSRVRHHHVVTESDTFQGICLKYKITATQLRQANCFSGSNLKLAPKVLRIPHIVYTQPATSHELLVLQQQQQQQQSLHSVQENKIALFLSKYNNNNNTTSTAEDGLVVTTRTINKFNKRHEIRAYLEMNDWNVDAAWDEMRADYEFEQSHSRTTNPPKSPPPEQQKQPLLRWC